MRNVLMVSPTFPPSGLPPAHRTRQFARYLPTYGWNPLVLTVDPRFYQEEIDHTLLSLIPRDLEVIRTSAFRPKWPFGIGIGDIGLRSWFQLKAKMRHLVKVRDFDLIYLPCPPNYPVLLGPWAKRRFEVPYVLDYIDPWQSDWLRQHARPFTKLWLSHILSVALEPYALRDVSHIIAVSKGTADTIRRNHAWLPESHFSTIPYGGEPDVVEEVRQHSHNSRWLSRPDRFQLVYLGAMWEAAYGTLDTFLNVLSLLRSRRSDLFSRLAVYFLGTTYNPSAAGCYQVLPRARMHGLDSVVHEVPERLPFLEAIRTLIDANALLMLGSSEPHYTASRLLPYLHAKTPLMAIFHEDSDATRLIRGSRAATELVTYGHSTAVQDKTEEIYTSLVRLLTSPCRDNTTVDWTLIDNYSVKSMTSQLASCFDRAISTSALTQA